MLYDFLINVLLTTMLEVERRKIIIHEKICFDGLEKCAPFCQKSFIVNTKIEFSILLCHFTTFILLPGIEWVKNATRDLSSLVASLHTVFFYTQNEWKKFHNLICYRFRPTLTTFFSKSFRTRFPLLFPLSHEKCYLTCEGGWMSDLNHFLFWIFIIFSYIRRVWNGWVVFDSNIFWLK